MDAAMHQDPPQTPSVLKRTTLKAPGFPWLLPCKFKPLLVKHKPVPLHFVTLALRNEYKIVKWLKPSRATCNPADSTCKG